MKLRLFRRVIVFAVVHASEASDAQSVVAEHEVAVKSVVVDWQDPRIIDASIFIEGRNLRRRRSLISAQGWERSGQPWICDKKIDSTLKGFANRRTLSGLVAI